MLAPRAPTRTSPGDTTTGTPQATLAQAPGVRCSCQGDRCEEGLRTKIFHAPSHREAGMGVNP